MAYQKLLVTNSVIQPVRVNIKVSREVKSRKTGEQLNSVQAGSLLQQSGAATSGRFSQTTASTPVTTSADHNQQKITIKV